jgi:hypothetical protein
MAKPMVTTAAASMHSVINWRMRLGGRSLIIRQSSREFAPERFRTRAAASGYYSRSESEGTACLSAATRGRRSPGTAEGSQG